MNMVIRMSAERVQFLRFLAAGVLNTCFGYSAFALLVWIGLPNDFAVICGMLAGMAFNFGTFRRAFSGQGFSRLPAFVLVYGMLLLSNILVLRFLVSAGFGPFVGQAIIVALITPISFFALRRFVFSAAPEPAS